MADSSIVAFSKKVEALGDVLSSVARSGTRQDSLERGLKNLVSIATRLIELNEDRPEDFERAVVPEKFRAMAERNSEEVAFRAWLAPEIIFEGFQLPLDQISRVFTAAVDVDADEAVKQAASALEDVLERVVVAPGNETLAKMALRTASQLTMYALRRGSRAVPLVAWGWFDSIVLMHSFVGYRAFDISYLETFAGALWSNARLVISDGDKAMFAAFVDSVVNSGGFDFDRALDPCAPDVFEYKLQVDYGDAGLRSWVGAADALERERKDIDSVESLREWNAGVDAHLLRATSFIAPGSMQAYESGVSDWRRSAETMLKLNRVIALLFSTGSFAIFREQFDRIPLLLDYAQPKDADASWIGWNPFPHDLGYLLRTYVLPLSDREGHEFWEGRHGHTPYDEEFALLLLARELNPEVSGSEVTIGEQDDSEEPRESEPAAPDYQIGLHDLSLSQVKNLGWLTGRLKSAVKRLASKPQLLSYAGIPVGRHEWVLGVALPAYLDAVKESSDEEERRRLLAQELSSARLSEFADNVQKAYLQGSTFRELLIQTGNYSEHPSDTRPRGGRFGVNTLIPRNAFIDIPYEMWSMADEQMGRDLARAVEGDMTELLVASCPAFPGSLDEAIAELGSENPVIVTARTWDPRSLIDMRRFVPIAGDAAKELPRQAGWYELLEGGRVPVLENYHLAKSGTLLVERSTLGSLSEYNPVPEDCGRLELRRPLAICVREISEDEELAKKILSENPDWLDEVPAGVEPQDALRMRVWLRVLVSYEYAPVDKAGLLLVKDAETDRAESAAE